ncbi:MAG: uracil-DNA glycosylase family protein [Bacilli bacterium]
MAKENKALQLIHDEILNDPQNRAFIDAGQMPLYQVSLTAKIIIIGQAPGNEAMLKRKAWADKSGARLKEWLNLNDDIFYDASKVAILPLDFFYPGKGKSGDLPPRPSFYNKYLMRIVSLLKEIELIVLVGGYAQKFYLKDRVKENLTATIKAYEKYLPRVIVLPHPSPLNFRWLNKNPWFMNETLPRVKERMNEVISSF